MINDEIEKNYYKSDKKEKKINEMVNNINMTRKNKRQKDKNYETNEN